MVDQDHTPDREAALWERVVALFGEADIRCASCRALAKEWARGTDIYGSRTWSSAVSLRNGSIELEGILHEPGPVFLSVFHTKDFGYYADLGGQCRTCRRHWHYRADYHFGMFDGCLSTKV